MRIKMIAAALIAVAISSMVGFTQTTPVQATKKDKVTICHRTNSVTNLYRMITVSKNAVDGQGNNDHTHHTGPVATSQAVAQGLKDNKTKWGDIIPPFDNFPGYNWTEGQAIYNNGCQPLPDFCDPSQRPNGKSIAEWLAQNQVNGADCFAHEVAQECGYLNVELTKYPIFDGKPYSVVYTTDGTVVYPANSFPAQFDEDENGGSVNVTWYIVGPEKDYLVGTGLPNFWDGTGETVAVDTDCKETPGSGSVDPTEPTKSASVVEKKAEEVKVASLPSASGSGEVAALISLSTLSVLTIAGALVRRHFSALSL